MNTQNQFVINQWIFLNHKSVPLHFLRKYHYTSWILVSKNGETEDDNDFEGICIQYKQS